MITFPCSQCGRTFRVSDEAAGRTGKCKACGATIVVPPQPNTPAASSALSPPPIRIVLPNSTASERPVIVAQAIADSDGNNRRQRQPPRTRRLLADAEQVQRAFRSFPPINVQSVTGNPPDRYHIGFAVRGLVRGPTGTPVHREQHMTEIQLTSEYPRQSPKCRMLTPIFHPNIEPSVICVADHWTAGERLVDLIIRIGEMIAYQAYNIKSPLDGEAAMWADQNARHLPIDNRDLRPPNMD